jgi:hypothetical protein
MKATYDVTWEEFAERFQDAWPRPDYFTAIVVLMSTVPLIGYGVSLALHSVGDSSIPTMFIGAPVLLLLATIFSLGPETNRKRTAAVAARKSSYEKWPKQQTFSFDEKHWIIENETGKQENFWAGLSVAEERANVIYLVAGNSLGIVPKRVLTTEDLNSLRTLAHLSVENGWQYHIRCSDYQAVNMVLLWRKRWFAMAFGNSFCLLVLGWTTQLWLSQDAKRELIWGWTLAVLAVVLVLTAQLWYFPLKYVTSPKHAWERRNMKLHVLGLSFGGSHSTFFLSWQFLGEFKETGSGFLLIHDERTSYMVPKKDLNLEQQAEFRRILHERIQG